MGSLKDNLNIDNRQTVTLSQSEIQFLKHMSSTLQQELDRLQQIFATEYLKQVAVERFEYALNDELEFKLDMNMYANNLEIIKHNE